LRRTLGCTWDSHHIEISADRWPDHVRLSDIELDFVCTACGKRGAEVRPKFSRRPEWGPVETCALVHQICARQRFAAIRQ
jgi:hypothetical protein